jgi:hypothetical protein
MTTDPIENLNKELKHLTSELATFTASGEHVNGFADTPEGQKRKKRYYALPYLIDHIEEKINILNDWQSGDASMDDALEVLTRKGNLRWYYAIDEAMDILRAVDQDLYQQQVEAACERRHG